MSGRERSRTVPALQQKLLCATLKLSLFIIHTTNSVIKPYYILSFFVLITIAAIALLLITNNTSENLDQNNSLTVITTIFPLTDITRQIAGPDVKINIVQLIPNGSSPHSFSLTPQQISSLSQADILFSIGHGLDDSATTSALKVKNIPTVLASKDIELNKFNHQDNENKKKYSLTIDPHYWLSVPNAQMIANTITTTLSEIDPNNRDAYDNNNKNYQSQLEQLEKELQQSAKSAKQKSFIAIHDAWSYFTEQYGFELVAAYEPIEGKQPSIKDIQKLGQIIKANQITTFFTEPQKQSDASARLMREEFNLNVKILDPLGGILERDSYIKLMQQNMQAVTEASPQT